MRTLTDKEVDLLVEKAAAIMFLQPFDNVSRRYAQDVIALLTESRPAESRMAALDIHGTIDKPLVIDSASPSGKADRMACGRVVIVSGCRRWPAGRLIVQIAPVPPDMTWVVQEHPEEATDGQAEET